MKGEGEDCPEPGFLKFLGTSGSRFVAARVLDTLLIEQRYPKPVDHLGLEYA